MDLLYENFEWDKDLTPFLKKQNQKSHVFTVLIITIFYFQS